MSKNKVDNTATPDHTPQLQAFREVVESRRSVRRFTDTPIPDDVLAECFWPCSRQTLATCNRGSFM